MNTIANIANPNLEPKGHLIDDIVSRFCGLVTRPDRTRKSHPPNAYSTFREIFDATAVIPKALLVARIECDVSDSLLCELGGLLKNTYHDQVTVTKVGVNELAIMLIGYDQVTELIPCLERVVVHINETFGDCNIGVARCPLDDHELTQLIAMAGRASSELTQPNEYQFICRQHKYGNDPQ